MARCLETINSSGECYRVAVPYIKETQISNATCSRKLTKFRKVPDTGIKQRSTFNQIY
jgi:hypothetical protein